jgi:hypothetical protein
MTTLTQKTMNTKLFLLPALAAAIIVSFSVGAASSSGSNLPKSDTALVYAQTAAAAAAAKRRRRRLVYRSITG